MQKIAIRLIPVIVVILAIVGINLTIAANEQTPLFEPVGGRSAENAENVLRSRIVSADLQPFYSRNSTLQLNLFDNATFVATPQEVTSDEVGQFLWRGTIEGIANSSVLFTARSGIFAGLIDVPDHRYRIQWVEEGDIYAIEELDRSWNWAEAAPIPIDLPPTTNRAAGDDGTVLDILIAYTDGARQYYGSTAATLAELDLAIAETNQAYQNSQINTQLRLVHTVEVDYSASSNMGNDLSRIQKPSDGVMDELHTLRDTYKADFVHLIVEEADGDLCGIAYLMSTLSAGFEAWAFGVTRADCTTGWYVLAHEVGHNMGSEHDPNHAQGTPLHSYSYGHWENSYSWRTLMAYNCPSSCPVVGHFSNPSVNYAGAATGVQNSEDNARSIRSALLTLANFRVSNDVPPDPSGTVAVRVGSSADDVEESLDDGSIVTSSSDLELINDSGQHGMQTVGMHFRNITIPQGATITNAYLEFTVDEVDSGATNVTIYGDDSDNATPFGTTAFNVSSRTKTSAAVAWNIPAWETVGTTQQSPELKTVVQEIVSRGGWQSGNSMVFVVTGSGERTAESYDGSAADAPLLVIEYESDPPTATPTPSGTPPTATPTPNPADAINFAVIGDFGTDDSNEAAVAALVASWNPDFVATLGDNVYGSHTFDESIGKHYCNFVKDVTPDDNPVVCNGGNSSVNRFFPSPGNHDHDDGPTNDLSDYTDYFTLPGAGVTTSGTSGSELYYDVRQGGVHIFVLDSESISNAGGVGSGAYNTQHAWLQAQLAASDAEWKLVTMHHPPYSSARHGSNSWMQWPYASWGADVVLGGHDHTYERIIRDGIAYFVNGMGGRAFYSFNAPITGSAVRYNSQYGAMRGVATADGLLLEFVNIDGQVIDSYQVGDAPPVPTPTPLPTVPAAGVIDIRISDGGDDVEEAVSDGDMYLTSSDLEMGGDAGFLGDQVVGLRFQHIGVPANATIETAYIEFVVEAIDSGSTTVQIHGEASADARAFTTTDYDLTNRTTTNTAVNWTIPAWDTTGIKKQSPELKTVVQEIIDQSGWAAYQSMVFVIAGSGERSAESYEGAPTLAPLLHIEYTTDNNPVPTATFTPEPTVAPTLTPEPTAARLVIDDYHVAASGLVTVSLDAIDVPAPGIGSANLNVLFDEAVLEVVTCSADPNEIFDIRLCNPNAASDKVTFGLTASSGTSGDVLLGTITFRAIGDAGSSSALSIGVTTLADTDSNALASTLEDGNVVVSVEGDVNCSGARDLIDAQQILQYVVALRTAHATCTLPAGTIYAPLCDVNADGLCDVFDAFLIVQCAVGFNNLLCPAARQQSAEPPTNTATIIGVAGEPTAIGTTATFPVTATVPTGDNFSFGTIALYYDPAIIAATDCQIDSDLIGACNPAFDNDGIAPDVLLFSLIAPAGATGTFDLVDVTFTGVGAGESAVSVDVRSLRNGNGDELLVETDDGVVNVTSVPLAVQVWRISAEIPRTLLLIALTPLLILTIWRVWVNGQARRQA